MLSKDEVRGLLAQMDGVHGLMAQMLYGTGMRLMECVRRRVKDLDLARREVVVRQGKGGKDRVTMVPERLVPVLQVQLLRAKAIWDSCRRSAYSSQYVIGMIGPLDDRHDRASR